MRSCGRASFLYLESCAGFIAQIDETSLREHIFTINSSDDEEVRCERRIEVRRRMVPFYSRRIDIYDEFYNNDQLYKTFRFHRASLQFIEGVKINNLTNIYRTKYI